MTHTYKHCQSCGMPFSKDELGGGTNADGSRSTMFCSRCYRNGEFQNPDINSPEKMQAFVKEKMMSMGFPGFVAGFFTRRIPNLERWKHSPTT